MEVCAKVTFSQRILNFENGLFFTEVKSDNDKPNIKLTLFSFFAKKIFTALSPSSYKIKINKTQRGVKKIIINKVFSYNLVITAIIALIISQFYKKGYTRCF